MRSMRINYYHIAILFLLITLICLFSSCQKSEKIYDLEEKYEWVESTKETFNHEHNIHCFPNMKSGHTIKCSYYDEDLCDYNINEPHNSSGIEGFNYWVRVLENGFVYHCLGDSRCIDCKTGFNRYFYICENNDVECDGSCKTADEWEEIIVELK